MTSAVDICNLALGHLGDVANVSSISPPDGSAQAAHCARFYPIARDTLLEQHPWNFAMRRSALAAVSGTIPEWDYVYAAPADLLTVVAVQGDENEDDYSTRYAPADNVITAPTIAAGQYVPRRYTIELDANGSRVIRTDQESAQIRYVAKVTDTTKFSPTFIMALSWHLAGMLAGPIIKGDQGAAEAKRCAQMMAFYLGEARRSDSIQSNTKPEHIVTWMANR